MDLCKFKDTWLIKAEFQCDSCKKKTGPIAFDHSWGLTGITLPKGWLTERSGEFHTCGNEPCDVHFKNLTGVGKGKDFNAHLVSQGLSPVKPIEMPESQKKSWEDKLRKEASVTDVFSKFPGTYKSPPTKPISKWKRFRNDWTDRLTRCWLILTDNEEDDDY